MLTFLYLSVITPSKFGSRAFFSSSFSLYLPIIPTYRLPAPQIQPAADIVRLINSHIIIIIIIIIMHYLPTADFLD